MIDWKKSSAKTLITSIITLLGSLPFDGFCTGFGQCQGPGFMMFVLGWIGLPAGWGNLSWLANPCLIAAWVNILRNDRTNALVFSFLALFFSLIIALTLRATVSEAGGPAHITSFKMGFWLWISSILFACLSAVFINFSLKKWKDRLTSNSLERFSSSPLMAVSQNGNISIFSARD